MEERKYCHYVFSTYKKRYILNNESINLLKEWFYDIAKEREIEIIVLSILGDHVHLLIEQKHNDQSSFIMRCIKGTSSYDFFRYYPKIDRCIHRKLWNRSYYYRKIKKEELEIVIKYIKNQTNKLGRDNRFV